MFPFPRPHYFLALVLWASSLSFAADKPATPVPPPPSGPSQVEATTFQMRFEGQNGKLVVNSSPTLIRFDIVDEGYSIVYNPKTEDYLGLEHRNYTYWQFSWPEVRAAVSATPRFQTRFSQLGEDSLSTEPPPPSTNAPSNAAPATDTPDSSGYVWHQTTDKKQINGVKCIRWTGDTLSEENVEVWCSTAPLPKVQAAMEDLRTVNDPVALVPVRTLVPSIVFTVYNSLVRSGVTPVLMTWGSATDKNRFAWLNTQARQVKPDFFSIPKLYMKTTLITMDGILDQKVETPQKGEKPDKK